HHKPLNDASERSAFSVSEFPLSTAQQCQSDSDLAPQPLNAPSSAKIAAAKPAIAANRRCRSSASVRASNLEQIRVALTSDLRSLTSRIMDLLPALVVLN